MPRKAATLPEEPEPKKKKTTKKAAAATTTTKKSTSKKAAAVVEEVEPQDLPGAAAPAEPVKAKRTTRKKAAPAAEEPPVELAPAPAEAPSENGASSNGHAEAPAPKRKGRTSKKAAAEAAETAPAQTMLPLATPKPAAKPADTDWRPSAPAAAPAPAPTAPPAPAPAPAAEAPQPAAARPRPLYISREVEAFLRAANIPLPTEKAQLDAIMNAMAAAKAAAQAAAAAYAPAPTAPAPAAPTNEPGAPAQQAQPGQQQPHPHQRGGRDRDQRHQRGDHRQRDQRDQREQREPREPREQREPRDPNTQPPQPGQGDQAGGQPRPEEPVEIVETEGYCEISGKGFGFLRDPKRLFQPNPQDVFVTPELVKRFGLRDGHWLTCSARKNSRGMQIHRLHTVNGQPPENAKSWPSFEDLTTISPIEHIKLETVPDRTTTRVMDLMTPIGKGQRGLIVAPPRTGKTTLLNHIAEAVVKNHPDIKLIILLVDERPEEVTDFKRAVPEAELWASSNDMDVKSHTRVATLAIERARRLVESGTDVFVLMDSITRMGRAFNNAMTGGGRTMSGGVDARALEMPRKIFAAARNTEEAGSLTIVATALIETGSRMDELIFQEFKGTGNSEIVLDRKISDQRVYPAIDIFQSGTRREELILPADALHKINFIRRGLSGHKPLEAIERMLSFLRKFPTNEQLLQEIKG